MSSSSLAHCVGTVIYFFCLLKRSANSSSISIQLQMDGNIPNLDHAKDRQTSSAVNSLSDIDKAVSMGGIVGLIPPPQKKK